MDSNSETKSRVMEFYARCASELTDTFIPDLGEFFESEKVKQIVQEAFSETMKDMEEELKKSLDADESKIEENQLWIYAHGEETRENFKLMVISKEIEYIYFFIRHAIMTLDTDLAKTKVENLRQRIKAVDDSEVNIVSNSFIIVRDSFLEKFKQKISDAPEDFSILPKKDH
jgi:hypothetical protein